MAARCRGGPWGRGVMSTKRSARGPFHDLARCGGANADSLAPDPSAACSVRETPAARLYMETRVGGQKHPRNVQPRLQEPPGT